MKKIRPIKIFTFVIITFFYTKTIQANSNLPLKNYLDLNDLEKGSTQIYLLKRCSAVYAYASGVILKSDAISSKNFIEISNNL